MFQEASQGEYKYVDCRYNRSQGQGVESDIQLITV